MTIAHLKMLKILLAVVFIIRYEFLIVLYTLPPPFPP